MCKKDTNKSSKLLGCESTIDNVYNIKPKSFHMCWSWLVIGIYIWNWLKDNWNSNPKSNLIFFWPSLAGS